MCAICDAAATPDREAERQTALERTRGKLTKAEVAKIAERASKAAKVAGQGPWTVLCDPAVSPERRLTIATDDRDLVINVDAIWVPYDAKRKGNLNVSAFGALNDVAQFLATSLRDIQRLLAERDS